MHATGRRAALVAILTLLAAVGAAAMDKPDDTAPCFLCDAKDAKSPLITAAYPLHRAVAFYDLPGVQAALAKGANVNKAVPLTPSGPYSAYVYTPLRVAFASANKCGAFCKSYSPTLTRIIAALACAAGPQALDAAVVDGDTPLQLAAFSGAFTLVGALLRAGADPNAARASKGDRLVRPLAHAAGCSFRESYDLGATLSAALLLAHGAIPKPSDERVSLQELACRQTDCPNACLLVKAGVSAGEAAQLKAGQLPASLVAKLRLNDKELTRAKEGLAEINSATAPCRAKKSG